MRKILIINILICLLGQNAIFAQDVMRLNQRDQFNDNNELHDRYDNEQFEDSTKTEIDAKSIPVDLHMWTVDERLGNIHPAPVDTIYHHFQNSNLTDGLNGEFNFLGNMGSPRISRIFFHRPDHTQFMFTDPYSFFIMRPENIKFTNTKSPFTNLTYHKAGSKRDGEDRFKSYFSVNVNKKLGIGFSIDYLYGRGLYASQSTSFFNGTFFSSYLSDHYDMHLVYSANSMKMAENGGIENDNYITNPLAMSQDKKKYGANDIPTILTSAWNRNKNFFIFLTHRYNLGFDKERPLTKEELEKIKKNTKNKPQKDPESEEQEKEPTTVKEFIPVTSFIHTVKIKRDYRRFIAYNPPKDYFANNYFSNDTTNEETRHLSVKNTIGVSLREGFSKWAKAGLTAFMTYEYRNFSMPDTLNDRNQYRKLYKENILSVGGEFAKREGKLLHYNITGDIALVGEDIGQFNIDGKMDLNFRLFRDTVRLDAHAYIKNINPSFYFRHFHSNHYWWNNNDLNKEFRTRIEGQLSIDRWRTNLQVGVENMKNYTYFGNTSEAYSKEKNSQTYYKNNVAVRQHSENIQVFSATLKQDFKLGILHLDNEVTYQKSSDNTVLPLPELTLYHNLYLSAKLAKKVLSVEIGADMRYFTKYYAPDYSPGIGQYYLQNPEQKIEIGNYPLINVYANIHLKRTRIYVMMYHVNQGMGNSNYFLAPHYPVNPRQFKFGISWNFFD